MQRGKVENATAEMLRGLDQLMEGKEGGGMYLLWVPLIGDVRTLMMDEAHASRDSVHSGADKTYYDLRDMYGGHIVVEDLLRGYALYGRKCKSHVLWAEIGEIRSIGSELVQEKTNKVMLIKEKLKAARDCQKSYVGNMCNHLELKLYWTDANLHVHLEEIKVDKTLHFVEEHVEIIDREVKSLKRSSIPIVKSIGTRSEDIRIS
ncbi:hypothetical protein Tco_1413880 [Tanacetum coccineum]